MNDMEIKIVDEEVSDKVIAFLQSRVAFDTELNEFRKRAREETVRNSLTAQHSRFWYIENEKEEIIGAIGMTENERKNGGYYLDYFAVHRDYRRQGFGMQLLQGAEVFVKENKGRFILVDTGDIPLFAEARNFYERNGFIKVGHIPEYYAVGEGRIDYYKKMAK